IRDFHVTGVQTCALPISWRNVVLSLLASIRSKRGETSAAKEALEAAVAATPPGADGRRLRSRCAAIGMELEAAEGRFRHRDAVEIGRASCRERVEVSEGG